MLLGDAVEFTEMSKILHPMFVILKVHVWGVFVTIFCSPQNSYKVLTFHHENENFFFRCSSF